MCIWSVMRVCVREIVQGTSNQVSRGEREREKEVRKAFHMKREREREEKRQKIASEDSQFIYAIFVHCIRQCREIYRE